MTSNELAALCNVSRATVDRVFNNRGYVKKETREKILKTASIVGYRPNLIAKSLVKGKTDSFGVVIPNLKNYFFSAFLDAVSQKAQESKYMPLVTLSEYDPDLERKCVERLIERQVDGIILFPTSKTEDCAEILKSSGIPSVMISNKMDGFDCVRIDYYRAMYDASQYVISRGYQNLVFFCPPLRYEHNRNIFAIKQRRDGFLDAVKNACSDISFSVINDAEYISQISGCDFDKNKKSAVLCSSDIYALSLIKTLKTKGIRVPDDIGVMGFDGIDVLDYSDPSIATVKTPIRKLGETAASHIINLIENRFENQSLILPHEIIQGQSII